MEQYIAGCEWYILADTKGIPADGDVLAITEVNDPPWAMRPWRTRTRIECTFRVRYPQMGAKQGEVGTAGCLPGGGNFQ